jgi:uncharacterized phage infection (PIP) family protein YhgE
MNMDNYGAVQATPIGNRITGNVDRPQNALEEIAARVQQITSATSELRARLLTLADRTLGAVPPAGAATNGGQKSPQLSQTASIIDSLNMLSALVSETHDQVSRLERL